MDFAYLYRRSLDLRRSIPAKAGLRKRTLSLAGRRKSGEMLAQSDHRCRGIEGRPCRRCNAGFRRDRHRVRRARGRLRRSARRRTRYARDRTARRRIQRSSASTRSHCRVAPHSGSTPPPAYRRGCANRAAALRSATRGCRSCRARLFSICFRAATRMGPLLALPRASAITRRRQHRSSFALGSVGAGLGATIASLKGGIGSASATTPKRAHRRRDRGRQCSRHCHHRRRPAFLGGAVRAGRRIRRTGLAENFGAGRAGDPHQGRRRARPPPSHWSQLTPTSPRRSAHRLAVMAHTGCARAIYPVHTPLDGDIVFAAATGKKPLPDPLFVTHRTRRACSQCAGARDRPWRSMKRRHCRSTARSCMARQVRVKSDR